MEVWCDAEGCKLNCPSLWPRGIGSHLGRNTKVVSLIPGSVGYISYPMKIEPTITWVLSGFSGYIWLYTKIVLEKNLKARYTNFSCTFWWKFITVHCKFQAWR